MTKQDIEDQITSLELDLMEALDLYFDTDDEEIAVRMLELNLKISEEIDDLQKQLKALG